MKLMIVVKVKWDDEVCVIGFFLNLNYLLVICIVWCNGWYFELVYCLDWDRFEFSERFIREYKLECWWSVFSFWSVFVWFFSFMYVK